MSRKQRTYYTDEFKDQIVAMYQSGKQPKEILDEYNLSRATLYKWVKEKETTGSYRSQDNRSFEENELIKLRKENQQLRMEVDILKQAALIMGRKSKS